jgi:hypothetical protein
MESEKLGGGLVHRIARLAVQPEGLPDLRHQLFAFL